MLVSSSDSTAETVAMPIEFSIARPKLAVSSRKAQFSSRLPPGVSGSSGEKMA